ncbi:MAG TPA: hypothetical protein VGR41_04590 [Actinomycetota bacterium]|jgi:hypothetical protein|nr:hypothetical protein [Actinomycetota bacterium]
MASRRSSRSNARARKRPRATTRTHLTVASLAVVPDDDEPSAKAPDASEPRPDANEPRPDANLADGRELDRLRAAVRGAGDQPGLTHVLPRLQRAHRKELVRHEQWTFGELARHPEPRELIRSRRRPGNLDEHGQLIRIFDSRRVLVEDVHENRVVRHAVMEVRSRLEALEHIEAFQLLNELDAAIAQAPFLRQVGTLRSRPTEPTATLSGDPLYRAIFQTWLELQR